MHSLFILQLWQELEDTLTKKQKKPSRLDEKLIEIKTKYLYL